MKWFKFYGQDFLTDTKIIGMDPLLRQVWVTLLCLADDDGVIKHLKEYDLIKMAGCEDNQMNDLTDLDRTKGCLEYFQELEMIALQTVTNSNAAPLHTVTLINYNTRQKENLSNAERQKRYRENRKNEPKTVSNDSNVTQRNDSNARREKNRIDKNIIKEIIIKKKNSPLEEKDFQEIAEQYGVPMSFVLSKWEDLQNWCKAKGKSYKDYRAALRNWVKKDAMNLRKEAAYGSRRVSIGDIE